MQVSWNLGGFAMMRWHTLSQLVLLVLYCNHSQYPGRLWSGNMPGYAALDCSSLLPEAVIIMMQLKLCMRAAQQL
jgi:hypothetical protein